MLFREKVCLIFKSLDPECLFSFTTSLVSQHPIIMQKSYLSSFHNDPRLSKYPNDKNIQPLFKKSFGQTEETLKKHLEEPESVNTSSLSNNRSGNSISKIRLRTVSVSKNPNPLSRDNLEYLINKLKSEKLEVFRDLLSYTEQYDHKLSLRARLSEMKGLCQDLLEMSKRAAERLNIENDLFGYLQIGTLTLTSEKFVCEESDEEMEEQQEFYQRLVGISGVSCICLVKLLESQNINISIYPFLTNQAIAVDLDISCETEDLDELLSQNVFPFLSFTSFSDGLGLKHLEIPFGTFQFIVLLKHLKSPVEVQLTIKESLVVVKCLEEELTLNDLVLLDLLYHEKILQASSYVSENLVYIGAEGEKSLLWKARNWEIEKFLNKKNEQKVRFKDVPRVLGKFDEFFSLCFEGFYKGIGVAVWKNLVSRKLKIVLRAAEELLEIKEESFQEEFFVLLSFQDFNLKMCGRTFLGSLEFEGFVSRFTES